MITEHLYVVLSWAGVFLRSLQTALPDERSRICSAPELGELADELIEAVVALVDGYLKMQKSGATRSRRQRRAF